VGWRRSARVPLLRTLLARKSHLVIGKLLKFITDMLIRGGPPPVEGWPECRRPSCNSDFEVIGAEGLPRFTRADSSSVVRDRRQALDAAMQAVAQTADPQAVAAVKSSLGRTVRALWKRRLGR
jgi:hypothetical protein